MCNKKPCTVVSLLACQGFVCWELSLSALRLPPLFPLSFFSPQSPFLDGGVMVCSKAHVIPNNGERWQTLGILSTCQPYIWTRPWHHRAKCLVSALKLAFLWVHLYWFPLHRQQLFPAYFWMKPRIPCIFFRWWWPYALAAAGVIKVTGFWIYFPVLLHQSIEVVRYRKR